MPNDCISRQAAIRAYCEHECGKGMIRGECGCDDCGTIFDDIPTSQPEIIRCKDCKHYEIWQLKSDYTDDKRFKPSVCVLGCYAVHRPEDWYCADAERRTDEIN